MNQGINPSGQIRERMMVHARGAGSMGGSSGEHIGTVDRVEGDRIKLTRHDSADGMHHFIPLSWVERVEGNTVHLSRDADAVRREWQNDARSAGSRTSP